jgi:hypothetical protein
MGEARERRAGLGWNSELTAADSFVEAVPNPFVEKLQARINRKRFSHPTLMLARGMLQSSC